MLKEMLHMLPVTTITASLLAGLYIWIAFKVIGLRRLHSVSTGDGGHPALTMAIRAHGNLTEYVPIALILLLLGELNKGYLPILAILAGALVAGRVLHALAFLNDNRHMERRVLGMKLTFFSIGSLAIYNLATLIRL